MKRPLEQDYTSLVAYTRALEHYCDTAQPTGQASCVRHCEANAFKIMIRNLKGDIERMKAAQPEQKPVALVIDGVLVKSALPEKYTGHLYTTPPAAQRTWVGLTDKEISDIAINNLPMVHEFVRAIEAKLKELNHD